MSKTFTYTFSTPADSNLTITTGDNAQAIDAGSGTYQGYAITGISGTFNGQQITGLNGNSGAYQQDANGDNQDNAIFINSSQGASGSLDGIDNYGISFNVQGGNIYNLFSSGNAFTYDTNTATSRGSFSPATLASTNYATVVACYCTGTRIRAVRGEVELDVAVEELAIGDTVVTATGVHRRIRWIGHRSYAARFVRNNPALLPIRFRAGSLGDGVPARDLLVSSKHAMFLDQVLIPAEHLINGRTITRETEASDIAYWHVELDSHDVLVAEGAASESFVDDNSRGIFHNAHSFDALYPGASRREAVYCAPRVEHGFILRRVHGRLRARAGLPMPPARDLGALRGRVDKCVSDGRGSVRVAGWAQSMAHPKAPVCLELLVNGRAVALASAELYRADLAAAGVGEGWHGFEVVLALAEGDAVVVRRAADGAVLSEDAEVKIAREMTAA